ncbi:unnamed protein product [Amoebophrya sp. A120]|nr:unnamed protein product [Amoebophrya sp. A120]|eukprot:GSA120T00004204001.1
MAAAVSSQQPLIGGGSAGASSSLQVPVPQPQNGGAQNATSPTSKASTPSNAATNPQRIMDSQWFIDPKRAKQLIEFVGLKGQLKPFGSYTSGLITKTSDLDVMYERHESEQHIIPVQILQKFMEALGKAGFVNFVTVFQAQLPLLKLADRHGVDIDIIVDNQLGYRNSVLMGSYARMDRRVPEFIRRVKCFAKRFEIVGSTDGHLNSYAWTLMAIYYLMKAMPAPLVPNLQALAQDDPRVEKKYIKDGRWGADREWNVTFFTEIQKIPPSANTRATTELLGEFFEYYSHKFDWDKKCVSIRLGLTPHDSQTGADRSQLDPYITNPKDQSGWYVEDPFDLCHNLAGNVTARGKERIMTALKNANNEIRARGPARLEEALNNLCPLSWRAAALFMKCRVNLEKVTEEQFREAFAEMKFDDEVILWWPSNRPQTSPIMDAFLQFRSDHDRKRAHTKSESYVGQWQIRLLYCCCAVLKDAYKDNDNHLQRVTVNPAARQSGLHVDNPVIPSIKQALAPFTGDPRQKNFQALRHLYFISQNSQHLLAPGSVDNLEYAPEGESRVAATDKLGSNMSTVAYLLGNMDANFLEHFLQDPRNGQLINTLQKLYDLFVRRRNHEGRGAATTPIGPPGLNKDAGDPAANELDTASGSANAAPGGGSSPQGNAANGTGAQSRKQSVDPDANQMLTQAQIELDAMDALQMSSNNKEYQPPQGAPAHSVAPPGAATPGMMHANTTTSVPRAIPPAQQGGQHLNTSNPAVLNGGKGGGPLPQNQQQMLENQHAQQQQHSGTNGNRPPATTQSSHSNLGTPTGNQGHQPVGTNNQQVQPQQQRSPQNNNNMQGDSSSSTAPYPRDGAGKGGVKTMHQLGEMIFHGLHAYIPNLGTSVPKPFVEETVRSLDNYDAEELRRRLQTIQSIAMKHKSYTPSISSKVNGGKSGSNQKLLFDSWVNSVVADWETARARHPDAAAVDSKREVAPTIISSSAQMASQMLEKATQQVGNQPSNRDGGQPGGNQPFLTEQQMIAFLKQHPNLVTAAAENPSLVASFMGPHQSKRAEEIVESLVNQQSDSEMNTNAPGSWEQRSTTPQRGIVAGGQQGPPGVPGGGGPGMNALPKNGTVPQVLRRPENAGPGVNVNGAAGGGPGNQQRGGPAAQQQSADRSASLNQTPDVAPPPPPPLQFQ